MIDVPESTFPKDATHAAWQKSKSKLDKLKGATRVTGLGTKLKEAEEKHKAITFALLDVGACTSKGGNPDHLNSPQEFDSAKQKAQAHIVSHVRPARQAIRLAAVEAGKIRENPDKLFTATTVKAATKVETSLLAYEKRLREIKLDDFDQRKQEKMETARQVLQIYAQTITSALSNGDEFIHKVQQMPTAAVFNGSIQGASRRLYQVIGNVNKIKSQGAQLNKEQPDGLMEELKPWANDGLRLPNDANQVQVTEAINKYARIVHDIREWWR